jgi:hypothetical protein
MEEEILQAVPIIAEITRTIIDTTMMSKLEIQ